MKHSMTNLLAFPSPVMCVAARTLWLRSYFVADT
jgi:hypothetical protein